MAAEHEGEADCIGYTDCLDPHHSPLYLQRLQLLRVRDVFEGLIILFLELLRVTKANTEYIVMTVCSSN